MIIILAAITCITCIICALIICFYKNKWEPNYWSRISKVDYLHHSKEAQSPIIISPSHLAKRQDISFHYLPSELDILNNGNTIQFNYGPGSTIKVKNETYELKQFHFHSPSENIIGNNPFPMELHLFHQNKKNHLAVVGVFIIEGSKNPFLELVWDNWPDNKKSPQTHIKDILLNAEALLPKSKKFYHYVGSLTTPPYTEGVEWFLMNKPIQASEEQILRFRSILKNGTNARPIQPLNNRKID